MRTQVPINEKRTLYTIIHTSISIYIRNSHQPPQKQNPPFSAFDSCRLSFSLPISIDLGLTDGNVWLESMRKSFDKQTRKNLSLPTFPTGCDFSKEGKPVSFFPFLAAYSSYSSADSGNSACIFLLKLRTAWMIASSIMTASGPIRVEYELPSAS